LLFGRFFPNTQKAKRRQSLFLFLARCCGSFKSTRTIIARREDRHSSRGEKEKEFLAAEKSFRERETRLERRDEEEQNVSCWCRLRRVTKCYAERWCPPRRRRRREKSCCSGLVSSKRLCFLLLQMMTRGRREDERRRRNHRRYQRRHLYLFLRRQQYPGHRKPSLHLRRQQHHRGHRKSSLQTFSKIIKKSSPSPAFRSRARWDTGS